MNANRSFKKPNFLNEEVSIHIIFDNIDIDLLSKILF